MASSKNDSSWFDDNFEVTYDDDSTLRPSIDFDTITLENTSQKNTKKTKRKKKGNASSKSSNKSVDLSIPTNISREEEKAQAIRYAQQPSNRYDDDMDYDDDDDYDFPKSRRRKSGPTRLAAPLQKGGNALYKVSKTFIRNLTILLIFIIIAILAYNFYVGSAPYGDLENSLESQAFSPTFLAYAAVAAIVIFCEIIALFRSMTKERIRDEYGVHWEDVGRGRNSFIILYICSYAAFLFGDFIPENIEILPACIEILKGIKGALAVFGSLHNQLFGLCVAGVVSCVIRKYRR
jgi:hypothetical protein